MLIFTRKKLKPFCFLVLFSILFQIFYPTISFALTGGPKQPEIETFSPISSSDLVDLFSGDFKYNIPLMQVGDYPINLIYNSNPTMDQEASWVGLGWNINPGSLNRQMRGLPDDFKSDTILKEYNITENKTWGVSVGAGIKIAGFPFPGNLNLGVSSNNYRGVGVSIGVSPTLACAESATGDRTASLGLQFSSQDGVSISAEAGAKDKDKNGNTVTNSIGLTYNTRAGLKELSLSSSASKNDINIATNGATVSFGYPTFTPTITMPMENNSFTISGSVGGEYFPLHTNVNLSGFWAYQKLQSPSRIIPSYGYLNSSTGSRNINCLLDYNREKDIPYTKNIPCLPVPNFTYDLFAATGEGMAGQFRPHRGDIGILFDQYTNSSNASSDAGIQIGIGNLVHGGANINQVLANTNSRKWNSGNALGNSMEFIDTILNYPDFENTYFKYSGEFVLADTALFHKVGDEELVRNALTPYNFISIGNVPILEKYSIRSGGPIGILQVNQPVYRTSRDRRSQVFAYLNADEAANVGLNKELLLFTPNLLCYNEHCPTDVEIVTGGKGNGIRYPFVNYLKRSRYSHKSHHISEVSITKADGQRYVYSIPTYNNFQKEVTFACRDLGIEPLRGLVYYSWPDNSVGNSHGIDHYFSSERTPGYAYSYLLSGILSPDYIDRSGNGITSDDKGEATRFNYSRTDSAYLWRIPFELDSANYNGGLHAGNSSPASNGGGDAKGSYVYGSKELWYTHSIESRTMIAQFYIEDREDGLGVQGENGGLSSNPFQWHRQKLLREIRLFSKSDLLRYGASAIPVKTVHFVYDYSLCKGVPNNSNVNDDNSDNHLPYYIDEATYNEGGKLTLRKVYFTYGNNTKGQLNSYRFSYSVFNPSYGIKNYDRWGNYKNNPDAPIFASNAEFPYTLQDKSLTDSYASAWNIKTIDLPSGGTIHVNLESDDYSYVQNKRAGQMFFISGFGRLTPGGIENRGVYLYNDQGQASDVIIISVGDTTGDLKQRYFDGIDKIFYRIYTDIGSTSQYDYLSGYAKIDKGSSIWCGKFDANNIWVRIETDGGKNPVSKQGWQFLRNNYPEIAYPGSNDPGNNLTDALVGLVNSMTEIVNLITGFADEAMRESWAKRFEPTKSFVRLNNPGFNKLGGGSRVKSIVVSDNWGDMAPSGVTKEYGQEYLYADTTNGITRSTGVANWEPVIGNDENPFKQSVDYSVSKPLGDDDEYYMEEPFGESFFPSPVVGYEKVTVANFSNEHIRRTATGFRETQFYTAREFPVLVSRTGIDPRQIKPPFRFTIMGSLFSSERWLVSQGYSIELNDMHGKEKSSKISNAFGAEISSTYNSYSSEDFIGSKRLKNKADVILPNGEIVKATIGEDVDFCMDMREQNTISEGAGVDVNSEGFIIPIFFPLFLVLPPVIPKYTKETVQFRSTVAMKVIHKYGLLEKVVATKDGSTIETRNLLHDSETGEVLLTQTKNEFNDPIYNWTYPAHWAYPNMGTAFTNIGFTLRNVKIDNGNIITSVNISSYFNEGDDIAILKNGQVINRAAYSVAKISSGDYRVMSETKLVTIADSLSNLLPVDLKVIRSGKRNMSILPIGSIAMLKIPPIDSSSNSLDFSEASYIINAEAGEFNDKWKVNCTDWNTSVCDTTAPEFCLSHFINSIINFNINHNSNRNLFYSCYDDHLSVAHIFSFCDCICSPDSINEIPTINFQFFNPVCWERQPKNLIEWQFGEECKLIMQSLSGRPINLDSLQPIDPLGPESPEVLVFVGKNHTDTASFSVQCISCHDSCASLVNGFVNPYRAGMGNNWHSYKSWNYFTNRIEEPLADIRIRDKGYYKDFTPFWQYSLGTWNNSDALADPNWVAKNTITRIMNTGAEVENKDALDNYTSALYGYNQSVAKAIATNSRFKEIANDNFEDYQFVDNCSRPCLVRHWNFVDAVDSPSVYISSAHSHTGNYSLFVEDNSSASVFREIAYDGEDTLYLANTTDHKFTIHDGCMEKFSPDSGKYILSCWVKENGICSSVGYAEDSIKISFSGSAEIEYLRPSGIIVEGWQRYEETFDVPPDATGITVELCTGSNSAFFDDIRLHPYHSNMKAFVYDSRSMRLMSELDENNYATFYEYDDEGKLVRVKKETERGIMTLKESRVAYKNQ